MNILYLTLENISSLNARSINTDLIREFVKHEHHMFIISPTEKRNNNKTHYIVEKNAVILRPKIGNIQKTNIFEKGITTITIESLLIRSIKKYFCKIKFDLVLYNTPPITFCNVVQYIKKRDNANSYLLLKDIFPQNAVDIGLLRKNGINALVYQYFRTKEKRLYRVSDHIGCMSEANMRYLLLHNAEIDKKKVSICPNSAEVVDLSVNEEERNMIRKKYNLPVGKMIFVYGGNLGRPQGIDFFIKCIYNQRKNEKVFFLIVGDGTEYKKLDDFLKKYHQTNVKLMRRVSREDYDKIVAACDVGMIFLDYRFSIPNFPSRILNYMMAKIPVLAVTDTVTDIGEVITKNKFGWWCESNDIKEFDQMVMKATRSDCRNLGSAGYETLRKFYTSERAYLDIITSFCLN